MRKLLVLGIVLLSIIFLDFVDQNHNTDVEAATSSLSKDVPKNTDCAFCNMEVYQKNVPFGVFSAQAIKKGGKVAYYDDISCLLYDEARNKETNKKYVRDYKTLKWIRVEKAIFVKTTLVSPMDDGYIYFALVKNAKKYVADNKDAKIVSYKTVQKESVQRYQ